MARRKHSWKLAGKGTTHSQNGKNTWLYIFRHGCTGEYLTCQPDDDKVSTAEKELELNHR